ncbi:MAG: type III-A CRISPR-associated protein Cas10/Csm1 [Haliscomenobacter sp.]|nr:type III-A CRISPR-associated protein Cas10/Csm1 [Haliscomenobacter sp.]
MKRETIFLAALLHDIGKFWQRADEHGTTSSRILSPNTKDNVGIYCPQFNGQYSHKHVLWTAEFLDQNKTSFRTALGDDHFESFFKAAVKHHAPDQDDIFQLIVQKADHYASGVDRTKEEGQKDAEAENRWDSFKSVQMVSIFEGLQSDNKEYTYRIPIKPLTLKEDHFPTLEKTAVKGQVSYGDLWAGFESALKRLPDTDTDALCLGENISFLLHKYACTVPSSTLHLPDVSLYDHLKSVGIFALCLFDYLEAKNRLQPPLEIENTEAPVLLVGGDLSGIQSYIYDIISKDAARNLKGRSFYLQMLVENAVEWLLRELALPWSAVVYASGGGFFLLAPNTEEIRNKLKTARTFLVDNIFEVHKTSLSLNIDWEEVTQHQILNQEINKAWGNLTQKIAHLKNQKFKEKIINDFDFFFKPGEIGGKQQRDFITGEEFSEEETRDINQNQFNRTVRSLEGEPIKETTFIQIDLGKALRQADFWVTTKEPIPQWAGYEYRIGNIPVYNYLFSEAKLKQTSHRNPDDVFVRSFDLDIFEHDPERTYLNGKNCIHGFTFYGGNDYPADEAGKPVTFDEMAERGKGAQKLGILRMDVDNLGAIFVSGLDQRRRTFSRYSVLSRNLDFFFKGYLNKIWKDHFDGNTSIIYSGGDDLFILGHWTAIFEIAKIIRQDFRKWVCNNPKLTISGGIALTGGKFPISKGALLAADAEKKAKEHYADGEAKNALTVFDVPLNWESELIIVESLKHSMVGLIPQKLPRGTLQKLMSYAQTARMQAREGRSHAWRWHMAYDFSRAAKRQDEQAKPFYDRVKEAAFTDKWEDQCIPQGKSDIKRTFLDIIEVAARWAELETK